ncbi:hypothetical protein AAC387_Pa07g2214 [Persea americana]
MREGSSTWIPEAVATLQLVKGPIGVFFVCGRARQGKSYILNQEFTAWRWSGAMGLWQVEMNRCFMVVMKL